MQGVTDRGHRAVPHTADVILHAWGPDLAACCEEAVAALVELYAEAWSAHAGDRRLTLAPAPPADLLVAVLDEVIFTLDTSAAVPVGASVRGDAEHGLEVDLELAPAAEVDPAGAVPKAISRSGFQLDLDEDSVRCTVLVDV